MKNFHGVVKPLNSVRGSLAKVMGFLLVLVWLFLTPTAQAQGADNLVRLAPNSWVYKVASFQLADPIDRWTLDVTWKFLTNPDNTFVFRAYDRNCALEVISLLKPSDSKNQGESGAVFLGDFIPSTDQKGRLALTISKHLSRYQGDWNEMAKVFNCLVKWDSQSYTPLAYNFYFGTAEKVSTCQDKIFYYGKAAGLNIGTEARFLLGEVTKAQLTVGDDCQKINSQNYKTSMVALMTLPSVTPLPTFTATPMPTSTLLPTSTLIPSATAAPKIVPVATTVAFAPVASATAVLVVAPLPVNPGEKSGLEKFIDMLLKILAFLTCLVIIAIVCAVGGGLVISYYRQSQAREQALRDEFKQQKQVRLAEGRARLEGYFARARELLGSDERAVLPELAQMELIDILDNSLPPLLVFHEKGLAAGQVELAILVGQFRKLRMNKEEKKK